MLRRWIGFFIIFILNLFHTCEIVGAKNNSTFDNAPPTQLIELIAFLSNIGPLSKYYEENPEHFQFACKVAFPISPQALSFNSLYMLEFLLERSDNDLEFILSMPKEEIGEKWQNYVVRQKDWSKAYNADQKIYGQMMHHTIMVAAHLISNKNWSFDDVLMFLAIRRQIAAFVAGHPKAGKYGRLRLGLEDNPITYCAGYYVSIPERLREVMKKRNPHAPGKSGEASFVEFEPDGFTHRSGIYIYKGVIGEEEFTLSLLNYRDKLVNTPKEEFPPSLAEIYHTDQKVAHQVMEYVIHHLCPKALNETNLEALLEDLGRIFWWTCQAKPWMLGDPSIAETLVRSILSIKGLEAPPWQKDLIPWIEVMVEPDINEFAKNFHQLFEWSVSRFNK